MPSVELLAVGLKLDDVAYNLWVRMATFVPGAFNCASGSKVSSCKPGANGQSRGPHTAYTCQIVMFRVRTTLVVTRAVRAPHAHTHRHTLDTIGARRACVCSMPAWLSPPRRGRTASTTWLPARRFLATVLPNVRCDRADELPVAAR